MEIVSFQEREQSHTELKFSLFIFEFEQMD